MAWRGRYPHSAEELEAGPSASCRNGGISMGTSIIAVTFEGGIILGADSRTSNGNYIANRVTDKITPLFEPYVYMLRSGSAADTQAIAGNVQFMLAQHVSESGEQPSVKTAANLVMQMAYQNKDHLEAGMIVAGWDKHGGGQVWGIPLGGSLLQTPFATGGSGSAYIYGYCDKYWRDNMTEAEAHAFVVKCLTYAMARDASSGGCIRTVTITERGADRKFLPGSQIPPVYGEMRMPQSVVA